MSSQKLTEKQEMFCLEFVKDLNATQAAIRAGYSESSAKEIASENLTKPNISARIKSIMRQRAKRLEITGDMVVQRLANIAFGHLGMVCTWTDSGLELKDIDELEEEALAIISEVSVSPVSDGDGGLLGYNKKVKTKDSLKALEMLSKHLGLLDGNGSDKKNTSSIRAKLSSVFESLSKDK